MEPEWLQLVEYPTAGGRRGVLPRTGVTVGLRLEEIQKFYFCAHVAKGLHEKGAAVAQGASYKRQAEKVTEKYERYEKSQVLCGRGSDNMRSDTAR